MSRDGRYNRPSAGKNVNRRVRSDRSSSHRNGDYSRRNEYNDSEYHGRAHRGGDDPTRDYEDGYQNDYPRRSQSSRSGNASRRNEAPRRNEASYRNEAPRRNEASYRNEAPGRNEVPRRNQDSYNREAPRKASSPHRKEASRRDDVRYQDNHQRTAAKKNSSNKKGKSRRKKSPEKVFKEWLTRLGFLAACLIMVALLGNKVFHWFDKEEAGETLVAETEVDQFSEGEGGVQQTEQFETTASLMMIGDILLHENLETYALEPSGSYDYSSYFKNIQDDINRADLALVSQEIIIGGRDLGVEGYPDFNAPNEVADDLHDAGFDVILHASNHAYDKGELGIINCLNKWRKSYPDMLVLGIHNSPEDAQKICYVEKNGIRFAILNYTYGINRNGLPSDKSYLVDVLEENRVRDDLRKAKTEADFVVVCPHWGTEYSLETDDQQQKWTQIFLEEGVDLVMGSHPHVIEKIETLTSSSGHEMLVYYSLGNFVNWTAKSGQDVMNRFVGAMANVTVGKTADGRVKIADHDVTALVCHITSQTGGVTVYKLADYTESLASTNELVALDNEFTISKAKDLCHMVWGNDWK